MSNDTCSQWFCFIHHGTIVCTSFSLSTDCFWIELRIKKAVVFMHAGFHVLDVSDSLKTARLGWWIEALRLFMAAWVVWHHFLGVRFPWQQVATTQRPSRAQWRTFYVFLFLLAGAAREEKHVCEWLVNRKLMVTDRFMSH